MTQASMAETQWQFFYDHGIHIPEMSTEELLS